MNVPKAPAKSPLRTLLTLLVPTLACLFLSGCATLVKDTAHTIHISIPDQALVLKEHGVPIATYPVSTSKYGLGDTPRSNKTPLGNMEIAKKIGAGYPPGTVFKDRKPTGEVLAPDAPGRDPIVSRILWLRGNEPQNQNAYRRYIYIHGTPEERNIGTPSSYGCIRMRSYDVIQLFNQVGTGAQVYVVNRPLSEL